VRSDVNGHTSWVLYRLTRFEIPLRTGSRTIGTTTT
jgi:hypothetical protein